jgi:hypothetical protein
MMTERAIAELVRDFVNRDVKPVVRELEHANATRKSSSSR